MSDTAAPPRRGWWKIVGAVLFLLLLGCGAGVYWYYYMRGVVSTNDARLAGELLDLSPQIAGALIEVRVSSGDTVKKDQVLFTLDRDSLEAAVAQAEAAVASARASLDGARATLLKLTRGPRPEEIEIAEATVRHTAAQEKLATAEWNRVKALHSGNVMTQSSQDKVQTTWEAARHAHDVARTTLKLLKQGSRSEDISAAKANTALRESQLAAAEAALTLTRIRLSYTIVRAPFDGVIVRRWQDPGAILSSGRPVLTILDPASLHVDANIEEKYLNRIAIGNQVDVSVDAYPRLVLSGSLEKILRATNSQFSLIPSEGASGTYIKVAQRIPLRIKLAEYPDLPLSPGLSVVARIYTNQNTFIQKAVAGHE